MRFLKEHSETVIKLFINQIGIAIFAFFLYTAAGALQSEKESASLTVQVIISAFSIIFYFVLLYNIMWEIGGKDKIRIDAGRQERRASKGILLGLFANAFNFIIVGIALIFISLYMITKATWLMSIFAVLNAIFRIFVSMYLGVIMGLTSSVTQNTELYYLLQTIGFILFSFVSAAVIHLSYVMGLSGKSLFGSKNNRK